MAFNKFKKAVAKIKKMTPAEKSKETKAHSARMREMQRHVNMSPEKRNKLIKVIKTEKCQDCDKILLDKGVIVFIDLLDVVDILSEDFNKAGIEHKIITSNTSQKNRGVISDWFMEDPHNRVVLLSLAGGESIALHSTNEIILYDIPQGSGPFNQIIGRVINEWGAYQKFYIRFITVLDTLDEYKQILLSSRKELEVELLEADVIPIKGKVKSFDSEVLKKIKNRMLWKLGKRKRKD